MAEITVKNKKTGVPYKVDEGKFNNMESKHKQKFVVVKNAVPAELKPREPKALKEEKEEKKN